MLGVVFDATGRPAGSLRVDEAGALLVSTAAEGGGGAAATAANQDEQTALLTTIDSFLESIYLQTPNPVDSLGNPLPAEFDTLAITFGYTGDNLTTIVKTDGVNTWTQTLAYTGLNLTSITQWVKA